MTWYGVQSLDEETPKDTLYIEAPGPEARPTRLAGKWSGWAMSYIKQADVHAAFIGSRYGRDTDLVALEDQDFDPDDAVIVPPRAAMPPKHTRASRHGGTVEKRERRAARQKREERVDRARENVSKAFKSRSTAQMSASGVISKIDDEQQLVFGWAYVTHDTEGNVVVDKFGDFVDDYNEIEKSAYNFVLRSRRGNALHANTTTSTIVESVVFTPEKIEKMGIPKGSVPTGWWVGFKIEDDEVWDRVKKGELAAFSVYGSNEEGAAPLR